MHKGFAHRLLEGLREPGAVVDSDGRILYANRHFMATFFLAGANGEPGPCPEVLEALASLRGGTGAGSEGEPIVIRRKNNHFKLSVYFLAKAAGKDGLHLIIASPTKNQPKAMAEDLVPEDREQVKLPPEFSALIGQEPSFLGALYLAKKAAQTDFPVLLMGESGTGKEVLARTVHLASRRRRKAFVDVNCAAIPDSLVESELFGYEKGAFTGANPGGQRGYFENAHGGSIFMDEIGDAAATTQAKLLRVLQNGQFKRVGGNRNISVDVRLISATNQELGKRVSEGRFRKDLLYRINTITIQLPPLRERLGDLPLLAENFLHSNAESKANLHFSKEAMEVMRAYSWPGNVRELKGVVDYAVTMTTGSVIIPESLPGFVHTDGAGVTAPMEPVAGPPAYPAESDLLGPLVREVEKNHILKVLQRSANRSEAIRRLGISRRTFYMKLRQYGLD